MEPEPKADPAGATSPPPPPPPGSSTRWERIRLQLVALAAAAHVVAVCVGSLPLIVDERGMDRRLWAEPSVQAEFNRWRDVVGKAGLRLTADEFEDALWVAAGGLVRFQSALQAPFKPYYDLCGTRQRWRMFPVPILFPSRLHIALREGDEWRDVTVLAPGEKADWLAGTLAHDRFRSALNLYSWRLHPEAYDQFTRWVAARAAVDFPGADIVRIRWSTYALKKPAEAWPPQPIEYTEHRLERELRLADFKETGADDPARGAGGDREGPRGG